MGMSNRQIIWDRTKLYDEVWEKPTVQLAKEYGISDVGLGKVCRQLNIPKPSRGYWRRKEMGHTVVRQPLPPMEIVPRVISHLPVPVQQSPLSEDLTALALWEAVRENKIQAPPDLLNLHPLVAKSHKALSQARSNERGHLVSRSKQWLDVLVTHAQLDRVLRILDGLIRGLHDRGHSVVVGDTEPFATVVTIHGEQFAFAIKEKVTRRDRELSPAEQRERQQNPYRYYPKEYSYTATGDLTLSIADDSVFGVRKLWTETRRSRLEDRLNDITFGFARAAERKREQRLANQRREQEQREWERMRLGKMEAIRLEEARIEGLNKEVDRWHRSQLIRAYVTACKASPSAASVADLDAWAKWALAQADRLDPLTPSPPSVVDEKAQYRIY